MNRPSRLTIAPLIIVLMIAAACSPRAHSDGHTAEADSVAYYDRPTRFLRVTDSWTGSWPGTHSRRHCH